MWFTFNEIIKEYCVSKRLRKSEGKENCLNYIDILCNYMNLLVWSMYLSVKNLFNKWNGYFNNKRPTVG